MVTFSSVSRSRAPSLYTSTGRPCAQHRHRQRHKNPSTALLPPFVGCFNPGLRAAEPQRSSDAAPARLRRSTPLLRLPSAAAAAASAPGRPSAPPPPPCIVRRRLAALVQRFLQRPLFAHLAVDLVQAVRVHGERALLFVEVELCEDVVHPVLGPVRRYRADGRAHAGFAGAVRWGRHALLAPALPHLKASISSHICLALARSQLRALRKRRSAYRSVRQGVRGEAGTSVGRHVVVHHTPAASVAQSSLLLSLVLLLQLLLQPVLLLSCGSWPAVCRSSPLSFPQAPSACSTRCSSISLCCATTTASTREEQRSSRRWTAQSCFPWVPHCCCDRQASPPPKRRCALR